MPTLTGRSVGPKKPAIPSLLYLARILVKGGRERIKQVTHFGRRRSAFTTGEKRKSERMKANSQAFVETPASRQIVTVDDYSATGAKLTGTSPPPSRRDVCLNINGLVIFGTIAWRRENSFGFKFDQSLNDFDSADLKNALDEARMLGREFDRESVLQELANKEPGPNAKEDKEA